MPCVEIAAAGGTLERSALIGASRSARYVRQSIELNSTDAR